MRLVALIILAPVSSKTDVTTSSYEGLHIKDAPRCADHFSTGFIENGRNHVELRRFQVLHIKDAPRCADHFSTSLGCMNMKPHDKRGAPVSYRKHNRKSQFFQACQGPISYVWNFLTWIRTVLKSNHIMKYSQCYLHNCGNKTKYVICL